MLQELENQRNGVQQMENSINTILTVLSFLIPICTSLALWINYTADKLKVGSNYKTALKSSIKINRSKSKNLKTSKIDKSRAEEYKENRFNNLARQMGLSVRYKQKSEFQNRAILTAVATPIISYLVLHNTIGFSMNGYHKILATVAVSALTAGLSISAMGPLFKMYTKKAELRLDMIREIQMISSLYRNSADSQDLYMTFESFKPNSVALQSDIIILLDEVRSYGMDEALTRFAERLALPIIDTFVIRIKALEGASAAQRLISLDSLEKLIQEELDASVVKINTTIAKQAAFGMFFGFLAGGTFLFMPMISEILQNLQEIAG